MAGEKEAKEFLKAKGEVLLNLESLQVRIDECVQLGMLDENSFTYNEVVSVMDMVDACHTFEELEEIIIRGKQVEHTVDTWVSMHGGSTMELDWPNLKKFL